jgi:hypothetical protein
MAKKTSKKSKAATKKTRAAVSKSKPAKKRKARTPKPKSVGDRIASAYHTVVDTVTGTDTLRNKMEKRGTSESE